MTGLAIRAHGDTNVGKVREHNEDALIVDPKHGLYAVFDGMGGASAGDVAANRARDVVHEYVRAKRKAMEPRALLEAAINAASAAVHGEAQRTRDRHGMGTTAVIAIVIDDRRVMVAHVGDSRAYLLREGRLTQLTRDHTVVMELVANGALSTVDAENHAYKNVLSRNLGAKPDARPDVIEIELAPGDRLMLCSDGLYGYASTDAIQYLLGSTDAPAQVAHDLIDLALRGGGGDNVTAIVVEAGAAAVPRATQILRSSGAIAWWSRRATFLAQARRRGLAESPICAVLSADEAIDIVAGNLCEAIFHDLEKSTGVNVWTYAENLAHGWFDQGGAWEPLAGLLDLLAASARAVTDDLTSDDEGLALLVDAAIVRAFITAEMAVGGVLAERLRTVESDLVKQHSARHAAADQSARFGETPTIPHVSSARGPTADPASPDVREHLLQLAQAARASVGASKAPARQAVDALLRAAEGPAGASPAFLARELFGVRPLEESGISPLFDALDVARGAYVSALRRIGGEPSTIVAVMRRLAAAQTELAAAIASLVVEGAAPASDRLKDAMRETASLRAEVGRNEARLIDLEKKFATRSAKPALLPRLPPRRDR